MGSGAGTGQDVGVTESPAAPSPTTSMTIESPDGRSFRIRAVGGTAPRVGRYLEIDLAAGSIVGFVEEVATTPGGGWSATGPVVDGDVSILAAALPVADLRVAAPEAVIPILSGSEPALRIGHLVDAPDVGVGLNAKRMNRHTFWCGQSGSGKTYALGVALERLLSATRLPIVVFDPNSDFVTLGQPRPDADPHEAARLRERDIVVLRPDDPDSPLRARFKEMSIRSKAAVLRLDPVVDRAEYNVLIRLSSILQTDDATEVVPHLRSLGDPDSLALGERIENLGVLGWTTTWAREATAATDVIARRPDATILDLGGYDRQEEQLTVALNVLDNLWERRTERRPVLLVIDEAHNLCPPDRATPLGVAVRDRLIQIAAEGRKFGLWLLLSTQRPGKIHPGIVSQCDNLTLMRMNSRADLDDLARTFGFVPEGLLRQASRFRLGEALLAGGFVPMPGVVKMRQRLTVEGGVDVPVPLA